jgi:Sucrase/ferredoxin-like
MNKIDRDRRLTSVVAVCEHGADCHTGLEPSMASAPEASRAWLLIEHPGPWPHEAADAAQPAPLVEAAGEFGLRVQLIRRPGRRQVGDARAVFLGWTAGAAPFLRYAKLSASAPGLSERDLKELADGIVPSFGEAWADPLYLVCTHGKRNVCCARLGVPLAQALAARHPGQVWETTHVGGHRFAANLVILPHGLYYGPVSVALAATAIDAYQRGAIVPERYRGRAGRPREEQEAEYARLVERGTLPLGSSEANFHDREDL